jgi:hypothetical protein
MNTITATNAYVQHTYQMSSNASARHEAASKPSQAEDSVHLSSAAKTAAAGDVDHDGDSH